MRSNGSFVVRLVLYAIAIGIALAIARAEWAGFGLDAVAKGGGPAAARIARWQGRLPVAIGLGTLVLAAVGGVWSRLSTFLLWVLIAIIVTAPFAIARATGG
jgi:hypothetical protein